MKMAKQMPRDKMMGPDTESTAEDAAEPGEEPGDSGIVNSAISPDQESQAEDKAEGGVEEPGEQQGQDETGEVYNASPEEQHQYDALMVAAMQLIYNKDRMPVLLQKLAADAGNNLSKNVGGTAANIMQIIVRSLERDHPNQKVGDDVLMNVGADVISEIMEVAVAAGICPEDKRDMVAEAALYEGMTAWGKAMEGQGRVTPELQAEYNQALADRGIHPQPAQPQQQQPQPAQQQPAGPPPQGGGIVNAAMGAQ